MQCQHKTNVTPCHVAGCWHVANLKAYDPRATALQAKSFTMTVVTVFPLSTHNYKKSYIVTKRNHKQYLDGTMLLLD